MNKVFEIIILKNESLDTRWDQICINTDFQNRIPPNHLCVTEEIQQKNI